MDGQVELSFPVDSLWTISAIVTWFGESYPEMQEELLPLAHGLIAGLDAAGVGMEKQVMLVRATHRMLAEPPRDPRTWRN